MTGNNFGSTPEALLGRNDSKNPATTCKGITTSGRPCRRALALIKDVECSTSTTSGIVKLSTYNNKITNARFYCWQHKDQAEVETDIGQPARPSKRTEILELKNRSSIDTLVERLGIHNDNLSNARISGRNPTQGRYVRPAQLQQPVKHRQSYTQAEAPSFWRSLCCTVAVDEDDTLEIIRRRHRINPDVSGASASTHRRPRNSKLKDIDETFPQDLSLSTLASETPAHIVAAIQTEINKTISGSDEEGYIYIFWLTPSTAKDPGESTARSLLLPVQNTSHSRRLSDVMTEYSYDGNDSLRVDNKPKKILLKIGRANNVTRRMNEWQRQCGHRLNLVRWYPYNAASTTPSPLPSPSKGQQQLLYPDLSHYSRPGTARSISNISKVQNVKKVERLIHLELADYRAKQACSTCGREHREWFSVEASEHGIRRVDTIIRRWVEWSEKQRPA